jgi:uncharacterized membrane protein YphA (DoxX/SURF4 family)
MKKKLLRLKLVCRIALGTVWFYEGLVPKLLFVRQDELELVEKSGLWWGTPLLTLQLLGASQILFGLWVLAGWKERFSVSLATVWMCALIILVASGNPRMLTDPYGALIKDLCLIACAAAVWMLSSDVLVEAG